MDSEVHLWPSSVEWEEVSTQKLPMWELIWWEKLKLAFLRIHPRILLQLLTMWEITWEMWLV